MKVEKRMQACLDNIIVKTRAQSHTTIMLSRYVSVTVKVVLNNFTTHFKLRSSINKQISYYRSFYGVTFRNEKQKNN